MVRSIVLKQESWPWGFKPNVNLFLFIRFCLIILMSEGKSSNTVSIEGPAKLFL